MRLLVAVALCFAVVSPAVAQDSAAKVNKHKSGTTTMWVGLGLIVVGGSMAATAHTSASSTIPGVGTIEASTTSMGQLIGGLAIAGGGGYLLWNGMNERSEADSMKSTRFVVATGKHGFGGFIRRTW